MKISIKKKTKERTNERLNSLTISIHNRKMIIIFFLLLFTRSVHTGIIPLYNASSNLFSFYSIRLILLFRF
jgi:hypothetical protein